MLIQVQDYIGKKVYVKLVDLNNKGYNKVFDNKQGIIRLNTENEDSKYYIYEIYFPKIDNSYLCFGDHIIDAYLPEEYPEYFI